MVAEELLDWQLACDRFAREGDVRGMRACAQEVRAIGGAEAAREAQAMEADAALYAGDGGAAGRLAAAVLAAEPAHLHARLVLAGADSRAFAVARALDRLRALQQDLERDLLPYTQGKPRAAAAREKWARHRRALLYRALLFLADDAYLAAMPEEAAAALHKAAALAPDAGAAAALYSKYLFMRNYRVQPDAEKREEAALFGAFLGGVQPYLQEHILRVPGKRLRIGYISRDFRLHAMAYFLAPFLRDFTPEAFSVYVYATGPVDEVTRRLRHFPVQWRDVRGRSAHTVARLIAEDHIDILVDLSGHTQDNALPTLAYHAASVQLSGLGYVATTGLAAVDGFLVDRVTLPQGASEAAFLERIVRLPHCQFCYAPGAVREMPEVAADIPYQRNGFVTFGRFNNLAKLSDETLLCWRAILDALPDSRLVLKGKTLSVPDGRALTRSRLAALGLPVSRIELRPFSEHYLEEYRDIDIALDPTPYTGGLTTCEALYMGVPVVTLRGRTHGSRFGASLLTAASLPELIAENEMEYVKKACALARHPELLAKNHRKMRAHLQASRLMDAKAYMQDVERTYRALWEAYCQRGDDGAAQYPAAD